MNIREIGEHCVP